MLDAVYLELAGSLAGVLNPCTPYGSDIIATYGKTLQGNSEGNRTYRSLAEVRLAGKSVRVL